jgi:hypothetical protein
MLPEQVPMLHQPHSFIIDVQPNFPCVTVSIRVKNIDHIVPAACRCDVIVEYSMELVMWWL